MENNIAFTLREMLPKKIIIQNERKILETFCTNLLFQDLHIIMTKTPL